MPVSENEIELFTSKFVKRYISQFWADILEFGILVFIQLETYIFDFYVFIIIHFDMSINFVVQ